MSSQFHPKSSILSPHSLDFSVKSSFVTFYRYKVGECDYLPSIPHGTVDVATVTVGSQATYSCDEGYALEGPLRRTCSVAPLQGAAWDAYTPTCKSMWTVSNRKDFCFDIQSIIKPTLQAALSWNLKLILMFMLQRDGESWIYLVSYFDCN